MTPQEIAERVERARYSQLRGEGWDALRASERETRVSVLVLALEECGIDAWIADLQTRAAKADQLAGELLAWEERVRDRDRLHAAALKAERDEHRAARDLLAEEGAARLGAAESLASAARAEADAARRHVASLEGEVAELRRREGLATRELAAAVARHEQELADAGRQKLAAAQGQHEAEIAALSLAHERRLAEMGASHAAELTRAHLVRDEAVTAAATEVARLRSRVLQIQERDGLAAAGQPTPDRQGTDRPDTGEQEDHPPRQASDEELTSALAAVLAGVDAEAPVGGSMVHVHQNGHRSAEPRPPLMRAPDPDPASRPRTLAARLRF